MPLRSLLYSISAHLAFQTRHTSLVIAGQ